MKIKKNERVLLEVLQKVKFVCKNNNIALSKAYRILHTYLTDRHYFGKISQRTELKLSESEKELIKVVDDILKIKHDDDKE